MNFKITFKFEHYFFSNFYQVISSWFLSILVLVVVSLFLDHLFLEQYFQSILWLLVFVFFLFGNSLISLFLKRKSVEYFFDEINLGFINHIGFKIERKKEDIKSINFKSRGIVVKFNKGKMLFVGTRNEINEIKSELSKTDYANFFKV